MVELVEAVEMNCSGFGVDQPTQPPQPPQPAQPIVKALVEVVLVVVVVVARVFITDTRSISLPLNQTAFMEYVAILDILA